MCITISTSFPAAPRNCSNGDVRLVGGGTYQGNVEVCLNGYWISVCSSQQWRQSEANIVCRQLGYTGNGELPIALSVTNCIIPLLWQHICTSSQQLLNLWYYTYSLFLLQVVPSLSLDIMASVSAHSAVPWLLTISYVLEMRPTY